MEAVEGGWELPREVLELWQQERARWTRSFVDDANKAGNVNENEHRALVSRSQTDDNLVTMWNMYQIM
jgi:hypothetical protein